jgi:hypothetical protein
MTMQGHFDQQRLSNMLRAAAWGGAALLFLVPVAAQQLSDGMAWTAFDFTFWGVMLAFAVGAFELTMRASPSWSYRFGAATAFGAAFLLVMATGAVGVIGSEDHPGNLLYHAVLALGLGGAFAADYKPRGMARAMVASAAGTVLVGVLAVSGGWGEGMEPNWLAAIVGATVFFGGAWLAAAWLFQRAAREQGTAGDRP